MKISELSGDSSVRKVKWQNGAISFLYEDYEMDKTFRIGIETKRFYSEKDEEEGTVHLELNNVDSLLPVEEKSNIYIMPAEFNRQMEINRKGYHVMLGLNRKEYPYALTVIGNQRMIVCPVKHEGMIEIEEV